MTQDTPDFAVGEYQQRAADGADNLDISMADLLASIDSMVITNASIANATLSVDLPPRYRSGTPIFLENFANVRGSWVGGLYGTGAQSEVSTSYSYSKGRSWFLKPGSDGGRTADMTYVLGRYPQVAMGMQCCFTVDTETTAFGFAIRNPYNSSGYQAQFYIDFLTNQVSLWETSGSGTNVISDHEWDVGPYQFHFMKLTFDLTTGKYTKLYLDDQEYDASALDLITETGQGGVGMELYLWAKGSAGNNPLCYVDDILITEE